MIQLILKELRALRPYFLLILGTATLKIGYKLATLFPDSRSWEIGSLIQELLLFGLMLGAGILIRESEEGTLSFLDGLPVSRTRIFVAKVMAGFIVLLLLPATSLAFYLVNGFLVQTSISPPVPWRLFFVASGLIAFVTMYALGAALALSFFRRWLPVVAGLIIGAFAWLTTHGETWQKYLTPYVLFSGFNASSTSIPWRYVSVQSGVAIVAFIIAWVCFCNMGGRAQDSLDLVRSTRLGQLLLGCARLGVPVIGLLAIIAVTRSPDVKKRNKDRPLGEAAFARVETAYYEFLFREEQREQCKELIDSADDVFSTLASEFKIDSGKERIVVDLASPVMSHAAAMTNWTKIRLPVFSDTPLAELKRFLGHETTHVFASRIGGAGFISAYRSTRFFNEGLATYSEEWLREEEDSNGLQRLAAAAAARGKIPFATLCDNEAIGRERDPELVYPFGDAFCRALVDSCGADAPMRVLREFARSDHGYQLSGVSLWRAIFQECGISIEEVTAAYDAEIEKLLKAEAEFTARIPRLSAKVEVQNGEIVVTPQHAGESPGIVVCAVERSMFFANVRNWYKPGADGTIRIPRREVTGSYFRYLIGWKIEGLPWPVFEPWAESTL